MEESQMLNIINCSLNSAKVQRPGECLKARFHEKTKLNKINHQCIQIDRWVKQTCRHQPMDIGAPLADDQTCYFIIGRQEKLYFGAKTTV